jgi:hypothetical protein
VIHDFSGLASQQVVAPSTSTGPHNRAQGCGRIARALDRRHGEPNRLAFAASSRAASSSVKLPETGIKMTVI